MSNETDSDPAFDRGHADLFLAPPGPYLLSHSVGLQPVGAQAGATERYFGVWADEPETVWDGWLGEIEAFRSALALLFHGNAGSFCPQQNLTSGLAKILGGLPRRNERSKIVLTEDAFPSLGFAIDRSGYDVEFIGRDVDVTDADVWAPYLGDDVAIALITHAHSNTGELVPVQAITDMASERGIVSVVDIAQSAGVIPIDVGAWNASFVLGSCVKWLCGGPGAGFLWADATMIERCTPVDTGWFSHADPFEFDIHHFVDAPDALRFWGGTPSVLPSIVATSSIELITGIGIDAVRRHNLALTEQIIDGLPVEMIASPTDPERRNGTVIVTAGDESDAMAARLAAAGIAVDQRARGLRISPHVYNTTADVDALLAQVR